jgi:hypothetical protein
MTALRRARVTARIERRRFALYDRRAHLGDISLRRGRDDRPWRAIDRADRLIGIFGSLRDAADAVAAGAESEKAP